MGDRRSTRLPPALDLEGFGYWFLQLCEACVKAYDGAMPANDRPRQWTPSGIAPMVVHSAETTQKDYARWYEESTVDLARLPQLELMREVSEAAWIEPLLASGSSEVRAIVPMGFEAYARIFFPFVGEDVVVDGQAVGTEHVRWSEVARLNGRITHAEMEQETIAHRDDGQSEYNSSYASLPTEDIATLAAILVRQTSTPDKSWYLVCDGYGDLNRMAVENVARIEHRASARRYWLLRGPCTAYAQLPHDPDYWWPDDRTWCFVSHEDLHWAYVAASTGCIAEIVACPDLEALETRPGNLDRPGMDRINDPEGAVPRR